MLKNKLIYLLALIIGGLFAVLYNEYFIGIIFLVAVLLPFVLLGIVLYSSYKIRVNLDTTTLLVGKEEYLNLSIYIKNTSIFPISCMNLFIQYHNEFSGEIKKENIQVALDQKSSQNVSCQITSHYCGNLLFQVKSARLYDFFHIWSVNKKIKQSVRVVVMPEAYDIPGDIIKENTAVPADSDIYSEYKPGDDPSEVFGIREYREGDKPNRIHWKLSYKEEQLMVKEFSDPIKDSIAVITELNSGEKKEFRLKVVDGLLDCLMSISIHLLTGGHIHKIVWYDKEEEAIGQLQIRRQQDSLSALEAVLKTRQRETGPTVLTVFDKSFYNQNYTHLIYITSVLTEEEIYDWAENHKGTIIYLLYVNDLGVRPVKEKLKYVLQEQRIHLCEIDIRNIKESIAAMGDL